MKKHFVTTYEAAEVLGVSPDTVLRWIKSGAISAERTLGGHFRISQKELGHLQNRKKAEDSSQSPSSGHVIDFYCWEYNAKIGKSQERCESCIAYKSRSEYCFALNVLPKKFGPLNLNCHSDCEHCAYYQHVQKQLQGQE